MGQQVKLPDAVKKEVAFVAGITGRTQSELLAESWREYREHHRSEFREELRVAAAVLDDPLAASVHASGMSADDLREIETAGGAGA
jgi:2-keto-4-pentenoate hydratase